MTFSQSRTFTILRIISIFYLAALFSQPTHATPLPTKILGLYTDTGGRDPFHTPIHQYAEMPLNHLGMDVVLRPISSPLPAINELSDYQGILTWFTTPNAVPEPGAYCAWLQSALNAGKRIVLLGEPGFLPADHGARLPAACHTVLRTLGVDYRGAATVNPFFFDLQVLESPMAEFERKLRLTEGLTYVWLAPRARSGLRMLVAATRRDMPGSRSALVFLSPAGGLAYRGYELFQQRELDRTHWRIDPFRFFEAAFGLTGRPRPDVTTLNGRRIFFSHIDGDGIFNQTQLDRSAYAGEIILQKIIQRYPTLPFTVSIIAGYLDLPAFVNDRTMALYRGLFSAPNVEPAAHGYAHPLIWAHRTLALDIPGYRYDADREIRGSVTMTNTLLQQLQIPKRAELFLWTGNCLAAEDEMEIAESLGIPHLNGGDSRFDQARDSYAFVAPIGLARGKARQIYTGAPNENIYTNLWKGPYYGYLDVTETFARTEAPRRVKPLNVYYHFYSGERTESLAAVQHAYADVLQRHPFPMFASRYAQIARDFFATRIEPMPNGFSVTHTGALRTIRFDDTTRNVDLARSSGVLGFLHHQQSLYVALDGSADHQIFLTNTAPDRPYLISANIDVALPDPHHPLVWELHGIGTPELVLGGLRPEHAYRIQTSHDAHDVTATADGHLIMTFPQQSAAQPLQVTVVPL